MRNKLAATIVAGLLCMTAAPAPALGDDRPVITDAQVYVMEDRIVTDLHSHGLFSEQIVGTVNSGLPAVVELLYRLRTGDKSTVTRGVLAYELRYDVWDDVYSVGGRDSTIHYASFEGMRGAVEALRRIAIVPLGEIDLDEGYTIDFSITVHPLRGTQQRDIADWVDETVRGQTGDSWRENMLNVNDLINRFFSRDGESANQSDWFRTTTFKPRDLGAPKEAGQ